MIGCDNDLCPIEWFHFGCMGLTAKPKGKWYCPKCRGDKQTVMKPRAQFLKELAIFNKEREAKMMKQNSWFMEIVLYSCKKKLIWTIRTIVYKKKGRNIHRIRQHKTIVESFYTTAVVALAWVWWVRPNPSIFSDGFAEPINFSGCSKENAAYIWRKNFP